MYPGWESQLDATSRSTGRVLVLGLQHPATAVDVQMDALAHTTSGLEYTIGNLASGFARRYCAVDALRQDHRLGQRCLALPPKLAVLFCADLCLSARLDIGTTHCRTSYHLGPSAQILISFSLNSSVCLSASLRSNLDASMVRSDLRDMAETRQCSGIAIGEV